MSSAEDVKAEGKEADPNIVSIKVRGQVRHPRKPESHRVF